MAWLIRPPEDGVREREREGTFTLLNELKEKNIYCLQGRKKTSTPPREDKVGPTFTSEEENKVKNYLHI